MKNLKNIMKVFNTKELEKSLKEIKERQESCNHTIDFLEGFEDEVLQVFNYCPKCGLPLKVSIRN